MAKDLGVEFHRAAVEDAAAARRWYAERSDFAARAFVAEIDQGLEQIVRGPTSWPESDGGTRRYLMRRFPFALIYRATENAIVVVAVAHCRRRPGYWRHRQ